MTLPPSPGSAPCALPPSPASRGRGACWRSSLCRALAVLQGPAGELVAAGEPHALVLLRIGEEFLEHAHARGAGDGVVQGHDHEAWPVLALGVERVELVFEILAEQI